MEFGASFGLWLKERRRQLALSQVDLANCVGCSVVTIRKIEADERRPSRQVAELLAGCLEIGPEDRATFLKVARAELRVDRLEKVSPLTFPQVAALPAAQPVTPPSTPPRSNIPIPTTPLLGRDHELAGIMQLLSDPHCRLLTLAGPGGIGKTRLALETAAKAGEAFKDGVYFIPLASLNAAEFIASAIASATNLVFQGQAPPQAQLLNHLRGKQVLLVLDNFEHLLPTLPEDDGQGIGLLVDLLQQAPLVKLLITSRERLNVQGEWLFEVQGLPVPPPQQFQELTAYSAVALFLHSARRSRTEFELTEADQPFIARICALVEGLPLGIELAASWVRLLSCREISEEIERSLDFLTVSLRDVPARHRSLRTIFDYSWALLSTEEQGVMQQLSLFRGGFEREAARQVAGAMLPTLSSLVDKSLLRRTGAGRYYLQELVRQYAQEQLQAAGAQRSAQDQHLAYYATLAEEAETRLEGPEQVAWLERLEQEHDNLRAALGWAFEAANEGSGQAEAGLRLAGALYRFWQGRGHLREGCVWLERGLHKGERVAPWVRARALNVWGWLLNQQGNHAQAVPLLQEGLGLYRQLADARGMADALDSLGDVAWLQGDFQQAKAYYEESLALCRTLDNPWAIGMSLYSLGRLHLDNGYLDPAADLLEEGLTILRQVADRRGIALSLLNLGRVSLGRGNYEQAAGQVKESLVLFQALGNKVDMAECFQALATLAHRQDQVERTVRLWAASGALYESIGVPPLSVVNETAHAEDMAFARSYLTETELATAWAEGQTMNLEQAVAYALADP